MRLGKIITQRCLTEPIPDPRCLDQAFQLANPLICPAVPRLVIRPSFALACKLGSVQFHASYIDKHYVETDVTDQTTFQSSDWNIAVVGAASGNAGNATGLSTGTASITGTYQTLSAAAQLTILGDNCCDDQNVAMMVMVDRSRSMKEPAGKVFSATYPTKLEFAKAAAYRFINEVNGNKDTVGLMTFTAAGYDVLSSPIADNDAVAALVAGITQTQQLTRFYAPLTAAIAELNAITSAELKVLVLISDGEDKDDSYSTEDNPIALLTEFKDAGGIVITLGVRAHDFGYNLLSAFSTGGFFLNAHSAVASVTLDYLSALKSYICASNCAPDGDTFEATGTLNYCGFAKWNVVNGHVDLIGNGFLDLLPDNGLYVDLAGSRAEHKGRLETKDSYTIEEGKDYRITLSLAGNNRVDAAPNSIRARVYARNTNTVPDQDFTTTPVLSNGTDSADAETYEYAFSYANANGETVLTPAVSVGNGSFEDFTITLSPDIVVGAAEQPSLVKLWKRELGTTKWYLIAEGSPAAEFQDTLNNARLDAALLAGTIDSCNIPVEQNTTGTPIVLFEQDITIDDFRQGFTEYNLSFTASQDAEVWLSLQQIETPEGYDATGLLLDSVTLANVTDAATLLDDNFNTENTIYVPPGCGVGTHYVLLENGSYGYATGYSNAECCSYYTTPGTATVAIVPTMTNEFTPEGYLVTMGAGAPTSSDDYHCAFDQTQCRVTFSAVDGVPDGDQWVQIQLPTPQTARSYYITAVQSPPVQLGPAGWTLQGSNNGSDWTLLDTQNGISGWIDDGQYGEPKTFNISSPASFSYYRITITEVADNGIQCVIGEIQLFSGGPDVTEFTDNCPPCPTEFPGVQSQDPSPLIDNEVTTPPQIYNATADVVRSCAAGSLYVPDAFLTVESTTVAHCEDTVVAALNGLRWEMRVYHHCNQWYGLICPTATDCATGPACDPCPCDPPDQTVVLHGDSNTVYDVTLRFRGIVERQTFSGIVIAGTDDAFVQIPSYPGVSSTNRGNAYYLIVTNPSSVATVYALSSIAPGPTAGCYLIDYTVTIPINAASIVGLLARSRDSSSNFNRVGPSYNPAVVPGIVNLSAAAPNEPFPGQFIQMDVISVVAQP